MEIINRSHKEVLEDPPGDTIFVLVVVNVVPLFTSVLVIVVTLVLLVSDSELDDELVIGLVEVVLAVVT